MTSIVFFQIVDDVFVFSRAGVMTYDKAFNILSFLEMEDAYAPWIAAITGFNFAASRLAYDSSNLLRLQVSVLLSFFPCYFKYKEFRILMKCICI